MSNKFHFSIRSRARMNGVDHSLVKVFERGLELSKIDFGIPPYGGMRSVKEQAQLYAEGKSRSDGSRRRSYHQSGKALDVYAYVDGKASWDKYDLAMVAAAILQAAAELGVPVKWGGLWKNFQDYPHFQIAKRTYS